MRAALALVFMLSAEPALARCHHYRSWSYPWPQLCKVTSAAPVHRAGFVEIAPSSPTPSAEAEPPPAPAEADVEELTRAQALETLKQELRMQSTQALELQTLGLIR